MDTRKLKHVRNFTTLSCMPPDSAILVSAEGKTLEAQYSIPGIYASHRCLIRAKRDLRGARLYLDRKPSYDELCLIRDAGIKEIYFVSDFDLYVVSQGITIEGFCYETDIKHLTASVPVSGTQHVSFTGRK